MATLEEVNRLAEHATDFRVESYDGSKLVIIGSSDLCYYHEVELVFPNVSFLRCRMDFSEPRFEDTGCVPGGRRILIHSEDGEFEVVAESVDATIGKVYHYDRGGELNPGERIAGWVNKQSPAV